MAASASTPLLPAAATWKKKQNGPLKWEAGKDQVWDTMVFHKRQDTLMKYPRRSTNGEGSDNMFACLKNPQHFEAPGAFSAEQSARTNEMYNGQRMVVGWSELGGAMLHMDQFVEESVAREILHPKVLEKWVSFRDTYDLLTSARQVDDNDYPDEPRSVQSMTTAVGNLMRASNDIRANWAYWKEVFMRGSCLYTDSYWLLTLGSVTNPATMAGMFKDVAVNAKEQRQTLIEKPGSMSALRGFLVGELLAGHKLRSDKRPGQAAVALPAEPIGKLVFSDDEDNAANQDAQEETAQVVALRSAWTALQDFKPNKRKHGTTEDAMSQKLRALRDDVQQKFNDAGNESAKVVRAEAVKEAYKAAKEAIRLKFA